MRTNKSEKRNENIALRLDQDLRLAIEAAAEQDRRPMASLVRNILEDWLRDHPAPSGNHQRVAAS